jgi:hypothetical protein
VAAASLASAGCADRGLAYVVTMLAVVLLPNSSDYENVFLLPLAVVAIPGELGLTGWLLWKGGKGQPTIGQRGEA